MNKERLLTLRRNLVKNAQLKKFIFDMNLWVEKSTDGCRMACCAGGLYVLENPGCGLSVRPINYGVSVVSVISRDGKIVNDFNHSFYDSIADLANHFDISTEQAERLFDPSSYRDDGDDEDDDSEEERITEDEIVATIDELLATTN